MAQAASGQGWTMVLATGGEESYPEDTRKQTSKGLGEGFGKRA